MSGKTHLVVVTERDDSGWGGLAAGLILLGIALFVGLFVLTFAFLVLQLILVYTICWFGGVLVGHTAAVVAGMLRRNWYSPPKTMECNIVAFAAAGISVAAAFGIMWLITDRVGLHAHLWMPYKDNGFRLFPQAHGESSGLALPIVAIMALVMTYFAKPGDDYLVISQERVA